MKQPVLFLLAAALAVLAQSSDHIAAQGGSESDLLKQLEQRPTAFSASVDLATLYRHQGRTSEAVHMLNGAIDILWSEQRAPAGGRSMRLPPPGTPVRIGGDVPEPRRTRNVAPIYPESARSARLSGAVLVEFVISTAGTVGGVRVLRSWPPFDASAVEAVRKWQDEPTVLGGATVPVITSAVVGFWPESERGSIPPASPVGAQTSTLDRQIADALARFDNADWQQRERAFRELLPLLNAAPGRADEIKMAVIRLLEKENAHAVPGSEQFSEFRASLVGAVAGFRDARGVTALVHNIDTGNIATRGLAALGRNAVDTIVLVARSAETTKRVSAARTLSQMLDPAITSPDALDAPSLAKIRDALVRAARDDDFWMRISSLDGLGRLPGDDVTALLTDIAERDPYTRPGGPGQPPIYLVRERAKEALLARQRSN